MALESIIFIIILILSIVLHEIAHGFVAFAYGDPTAKLEGRLTLNPLKHIDPLGSIIIPGFLVLLNATLLFGWAKPVPYNPYNLPSKFAEGMVAFAGCFVNFLLVLVFSLVLFIIPDLSEELVKVFGIIIVVNLFLGIINLLPIPPLDGSKILKTILPSKLEKKFEEFENNLVARLGIFGTFAVVFLIIFLLLTPIANGVYLYLSWITGGVGIY